MSEPAANQIKAKQICYIDDSKTSAYVTKKMLKQHGYTVDYFPDAESALESFMENQYELLITDLLISSDGGVNGDDLIRIIRQSGHPDKANIPIVVVTGATDEQSLEEAKLAGANRVLQKPLNGNMLHMTIQALVRRKAKNKSDINPIENNGVLTAKVFPYERSSEKKAPSSDESAPQSLIQKLNAGELAESTLDKTPTDKVERAESTAQPEVKISRVENLTQKPETQVTNIEIPTLTSSIEPDVATTESDYEIPQLLNEIEVEQAKAVDNSVHAEIETEIEVIPEQIQPSVQKQEKVEKPEALKPALDEKQHKKTENKTPEVELVQASSPSSTAKVEDNPLLELLDKLEGDDDLISDTVTSKPKTGFKIPHWAMKTIWISLIFALAVPAFSFWYMGQKVVQVQTLQSEKMSIHSQISVPGRVVSMRKIDVSARDNGQLTKVLVKEGEKVKEGQLLARIDDREADSQVKRVEARLLSVEEEVAATSKTQERLQRALDMGAVSRQRVEDAESAWKTASANQSVIEEELRAAKMKYNRLKIRAPFDGVITGVYVQEGQWLAQSDPILTIVDMEQRMVEIRVDASDSASLNVGQEVVLSSDAFPGKAWKETITKVGSEAKKEDLANIIKVNASLSEDAPSLKIGQQVDAEIRTASRENASTLPYYVVFTHNNAPHVAVIENGKIVYVPVSTGIEGITHIEIIKGLRDQQDVVIPPGDVALEEGMYATAGDNVGNVVAN